MASTREEALTHAKAMEDHLSQSSAGPSGMQLDDQDEPEWMVLAAEAEEETASSMPSLTDSSDEVAECFASRGTHIWDGVE